MVHTLRNRSSGFNSRTREGCDGDQPLRALRAQGFNSRTREGCDTSTLSKTDTHALFQFTHPGGVRLTLQAGECFWAEFQFTHPGGVRPPRQQTIYATIWFQFTHPGGVRRLSRRDGARLFCFNSRTREGCDFQDLIDKINRVPFQFTHPGGVRLI